jgi:hypothetical protein
MVTGFAVHARAELLLFAGLSALGTAKPVTIFLSACFFDMSMPLDITFTVGVLVLLWVWVLSVPPCVKRVRSLRCTKATGLALPRLILLTDRGFTRWALRHEYEHIRQMRRYSPLGMLVLLGWHYSWGYLFSVARHRRWPDFWQLWWENPLERQANAAANQSKPLPFMFGNLPEE